MPCALPGRRAFAPVLALFSSALLALSSPALADETSRLEGRVVESGGAPIAGASLLLLASGRRATSGEDGTFAMDDVPAGRDVLQVERIGFEPNARALTFLAGQRLEVEIPLEAFHHEETVVVSAVSGARATSELYQPVSVLSGSDLVAEMEPSLGQTLDQEAGVSSTFFGPGSSRPLIRGLGGDRVRVMSNGLEAGDASATSPDHAVAADPMQAQRIEVVRGPATLRWGSNAIGGVVNVIDERLPTELSEDPIGGTVQLLGGSNADERSASATLGGAVREMAWHVDGFARDAGDHRSASGVVPNSWTESSGAAAGLSWIGERGRFGASLGTLATNYGSPVEDEIAIDLEQHRWDVEGEARWEGSLRGLLVRAGGSDYEHVELEGDEVGTRFLNDAFEARAEASHVIADRHEGSFGLQWTGRDFAAIGDEAFVPPSRTRTFGLFALQEVRLGQTWRLQAGARGDWRDAEALDGSGLERSLSGLSASLGVLRSGEGRGPGLHASLSRMVKLPTAEELFSDGPHLATNAYEIGDPGLGEEIAVGLEAGLAHREEWWSIEANLFWQQFDGFIREAPTGEVEDGLPVYRFLQSDATLRGGEIEAEIALNRHERHHLRLEIALEHVLADTEDDGPLPRIPPFTGSLTMRYDGPRAWAFMRGTWAAEQDRAAPFETETDGYLLLDAQFGWRFIVGQTVHDIIVRGSNLGDELAFQHSSFIKDIAPLPGVSAILAYRLVF